MVIVVGESLVQSKSFAAKICGYGAVVLWLCFCAIAANGCIARWWSLSFWAAASSDGWCADDIFCQTPRSSCWGAWCKWNDVENSNSNIWVLLNCRSPPESLLTLFPSCIRSHWSWLESGPKLGNQTWQEEQQRCSIPVTDMKSSKWSYQIQ